MRSPRIYGSVQQSFCPLEPRAVDETHFVDLIRVAEPRRHGRGREGVPTGSNGERADAVPNHRPAPEIDGYEASHLATIKPEDQLRCASARFDSSP
jgi:hypothetical protein